MKLICKKFNDRNCTFYKEGEIYYLLEVEKPDGDVIDCVLGNDGSFLPYLKSYFDEYKEVIKE